MGLLSPDLRSARERYEKKPIGSDMGAERVKGLAVSCGHDSAVVRASEQYRGRRLRCCYVDPPAQISARILGKLLEL